MKNLIKLFACVDEQRLNSTNSLQQGTRSIRGNRSKSQETTTPATTTSRLVTTPDATRRSHQYHSVIFKPERYNLTEKAKSSSYDDFCLADCQLTGSNSSLTISNLEAQDYVTKTSAAATKTTKAAATPSDQVTSVESSDLCPNDCQRSLNSINSIEQKQKVTNHLGDQADKHCFLELKREEEEDVRDDNNHSNHNISWLNLGNYLPTFYYCQQNKKLLNYKQQQVENNFSTETKTTTVNDNQRATSHWRDNNYKTINLVGQGERATRNKEVELTKEEEEEETKTTTTKPITISDEDDLDDWVLLSQETTLIDSSDHRHHKQQQCNYIKGSSSFCLINQKNTRRPAHQRNQQMALNEADIELIRASWIPARKDTVSAGVLLFKGLFTKFPDYLKFFPNFSDLDIERMRENKRLLKHAVKVIDTVTFVVDSIGDDSKSKQLNDALVNLVRGHLKRKIGLTEFRNLGIVIIDFICDLNININKIDMERSTGTTNINSLKAASGYHQSSTGSSQEESETMTSALDKIRASTSSSSSSDEESFATGATSVDDATSGLADSSQPESSSRTIGGRIHKDSAYESINHQHTSEDQDDMSRCSSSEDNNTKSAKLDTNLLVAAWTKLYSIILDLVKREEEQANNN